VQAVHCDARGCLVQSSAGDFRARVLIGADGVSSIVRRELGFAANRYHAQAIEVDTERVPADLARDLLVFDVQNRDLPGYYWDFPTIVAGRELMCRGVYVLKTGRDDPAIEIQSVLASELATRGLDLARCKKKRFAERGFDSPAPLSCPCALLVGEAAGIDPVTGEGIAQAVQYGAVAGNYVARKLRERDLSFTDWRSEVKSTMLGRDLLTRGLGVGLFYGNSRPAIERFLLETPDFLRVGMQHFAGQNWSRAALLRSARNAALHAARWAMNPTRSAPRD
jgi:flavin-dependent dehydrogenase